jgi:hypothetical protein
MEQNAAGPAGLAWVNYLQSIQELHQRTLGQYQQLWNEYVQTVQSAQSDSESGHAEAYRTYVQDVQAALSSSDEQGAAVGAYQTYLEALRETHEAGSRESIEAGGDPAGSTATARNAWLDPERTRRILEAYNAYVDAVSKWQDATQERLGEAGRKYAASLTENAEQDDAAATAKAAYEKYVAGVYDTYKSSVEEVRTIPDRTAEDSE